MTTFDSILPRLAATYEAGRLVPFIGSGMSVPVCTDWWTFVHRLECEATGTSVQPFSRDMSRDELIGRANDAVRSLKSRARGVFPKAVGRALLSEAPPPRHRGGDGRKSSESPAPIPTQTRALARLWWPLVLTTNYDDCYVAAARESFPDRQMAIVGRGIEDCQRVLTSLSVPGRSLLWTLQGYLGAPFTPKRVPELAALANELVVGHEEYRRVTYRDLHFRRAFAEVFRQRSLLFLGAGIQETYLQELFGEVLEQFGPCTRPHYAFLERDKVDAKFMLSRFQIVVIEYDKGRHDTVIAQLDQLADWLDRPTRAPVAWSWGRVVSDGASHWRSVPDLDVVRGPLPTERSAGECLAVSAGGSGGKFIFSDGIQRLMQQWQVRPGESPAQRSKYLGRYVDRHVFAVRARGPGDERSLAHVYDASLDLFERVAARYRCIRMQLLATGGQDKIGSEERSMVPQYPERFSFIQTVRAWGTWRESHPEVDCRLALHVVLDTVYHDVASGRIDVLELLACRDVRFFVEVVRDDGGLERRLFQMLGDRQLAEVVRQLQLSPDHWTVQVTPPPSVKPSPEEPVRGRLGDTLQALGVVPGSTMHFRRRGRGRRAAPQ